MPRNKWIVLLTAFCWFALGSDVSAQYRWTTVNDKLGRPLGVKENIVTKAAHRVHGLRVNISQYGADIASLQRADVDDLARSFLADYSSITKVEPSNLSPPRVVSGDGCWYISYEQLYQGIPVLGTQVGFTIEKSGRIHTLGADVYSDIEVDTEPKISIEQALETAENAFRTPGIEEVKLTKEIATSIYPEISDDRISYYLIYEVALASTNPTKQWIYFIDALSEEIVWAGSTLRSARYWRNRGYVNHQYWPKREDDPPVTGGPEVGVNVKIFNIIGQQMASGQTDGSGYYSINWQGAYSVYFLQGSKTLNYSGSYARILNAETEFHNISFNPASSYTHNWDWVTDEYNVYHHVNVVHDYWTGSPFNYSAMNYRMDATVHDGGANGWSDGTNIGFGTYYGQNWARYSDLVYHEYTHSVVYHIYGHWIDPPPWNYNSEAKAMDEGIGDYYACSINGDALWADGITGVPDTPRDIGANWVRPTNWVDYDPHQNGRIISGACWDMRQSSMGITYTDKLVYLALVRTPHPDNFDDFAENVALADLFFDGGNSQLIESIFSAHGISIGCAPCHGAPKRIADLAQIGAPKVFRLDDSTPNPFNPATTIGYELPVSSRVTLTIYDLRGREVRSWRMTEETGHKQVAWGGTDNNGQPVAAGIYLYRLVAVPSNGGQPFTSTRKMVLLK